jgi:hypothetical protein
MGHSLISFAAGQFKGSGCMGTSIELVNYVRAGGGPNIVVRL